MAFLTRDQVAGIVSKAPKGADQSAVVKELLKQGHELEGFSQTPEPKKTFGQKVAGVLGIDKFGQGLGQAAYNAGESRDKNSLESINNKNESLAATLTKKIQDNRRQGKDTKHLEKALDDLNNSLNRGASDIASTGTGGLTGREVLGSAANTALSVIGAGSFGAAAKGAKTGELLAKALPDAVGGASKAQGLLKGALGGAKSAILPGAAMGAASSVAADVGSGKDLSAGEIAKDVVRGGAAGGLFSGLVGGVAGGIGGYARNKMAVTNQITKALKTDPDLVARYSQDVSTGKIVKDKVAVEAIKQGLDESKIATVKNASLADKGAMQKMLAIAETGSKNARQVERATDVSGETFLKPVSHLKDTLKQAGAEVDTAAETLKGQKVKGGENLVGEFEGELAKSGVGITEEGLDFKGSDFEDLGDVEKSIERVYNRLKSAGDDAYEIHRAKRYIDEVVDYGNSETGLKGSAKSLLKGVRARADKLLDSQFASYDKANVKYRDSISALNEVGDLMGSRFNLSNIDSEFSNMKAGSVMRRILGNGASRADLLQVIGKVQDIAKKYGFKGNEDVIRQVVFADLLESIYGTQATTGLQGQVEKAVTGAGARLMQGNYAGAAMSAAKSGVDAARGVSKEGQIEALRKLIGG